MPDTFTILMLVALFALMYFMLVRPAQKKAREQQELVSTLQPGGRIMTSSGIFGTIRHIGDTQAIIEISPGVEMTVLKQAIMRTVKPEDDEFEYDDEDVDVSDRDGTDGVPAVDPLAEDDHDVAAEDAPVSDDTDPKR